LEKSPNWELKALEYFPELEDKINQNQFGPTSLWTELYFALVNAYDQQPINEGLIARIYEYAAWCLRQPEASNVESDPLGCLRAAHSTRTFPTIHIAGYRRKLSTGLKTASASPFRGRAPTIPKQLHPQEEGILRPYKTVIAACCARLG
jgi:hypothetical protein